MNFKYISVGEDYKVHNVGIVKHVHDNNTFDVHFCNGCYSGLVKLTEPMSGTVHIYGTEKTHPIHLSWVGDKFFDDVWLVSNYNPPINYEKCVEKLVKYLNKKKIEDQSYLV